MLKKLKNTAGLTLVELMVTLLLLSLFSSACLVGINAAFASRRDHIRIGDADILKATLTEAISQELRMCTKIEGETTDSPTIKYEGGLTVDGELQKKAMLSVGDDSEAYKGVPDPEGRLIKTIRDVVVDDNPKDVPYKILNDSAYGEDGLFMIKDLKFTADKDAQKISVEFRIVDGNDVEYATAEFDVYPLNKFDVK